MMVCKMSYKRSHRTGLLAAAAPLLLPLVPRTVVAAPTVNITNEGTAEVDGTLLPGYTAYVLTVTADTGQLVAAINAGTSPATDGFFGTFLQDYVPGRSAGNGTPTPIEAGYLNNSDFGTDTHFLVAAGNMAVGSTPTENSNQSASSAGLTNTSADDYGLGTLLTGAFGLTSAAQANALQVAYFVVPNGSSARYNIAVVENVTPGSVSNNTFQLTGNIVSAPIVSLTAGTTVPSATTAFTPLTTANTTFSPATPVANSINVAGRNGSYTPGFANVNTTGGIATGYVETSGFSPASDTEVYAIKLDQNGTALSPTDAQVQTIVNDINAFSASDGVVASRVADSSTLSRAGNFGTYDILLTSNNTVAAQDILTFNFANDPNVAGLTVTNIAAIPEPASLAIVTAGAVGLLTVRRRRFRQDKTLGQPQRSR